MTLIPKIKKYTVSLEQNESKRLLFIDMARSIAILLMLEGHFIEVVFENFRPMVDTFKTDKTSGNIFFDYWYFIKGFTAPMFFTVTGIVFVFLLVDDQKLRNNVRIKKGIRRSIELIIWGYLLQINLRYLGHYFTKDIPSWLTAYHVLQSIGIGILMLLVVYIIQRIVKFGNLWIYYFIVATIVFMFYPFIKSLPQDVFFPEKAPMIIQNIFKGQHSVFPIVPWLAFTLYGGMIGAIVKKYRKKIKSTLVIVIFLGIGILLTCFSYQFCKFVDTFAKLLTLNDNLAFVANAWLYSRLGQIILVLGVLILIEKLIAIKNNLFLKVGQNTLPIYIIHVIILYGGIFGFGLNKILSKQLNGTQSVIGATLFIAFFVVMIRYWDLIERWWATLKKRSIRLMLGKK